jgi:hypothetical protein
MLFSIIADYTVNLSRALLLGRDVCHLVCPSFLWKANKNKLLVLASPNDRDTRHWNTCLYGIIVSATLEKRNITRDNTFSQAIFTLVKDAVCGVLCLRVKKLK